MDEGHWEDALPFGLPLDVPNLQGESRGVRRGAAGGSERPGADADAGGMQAPGRHTVGATHGGTAFTGVALPAGSPGRQTVLGPSLST